MSETPAAADFAALQETTSGALVSAPAAALAAEILRDAGSISNLVERVGAFFLAYDGVDAVAGVMTRLDPDDTSAWLHLGERAWLREWTRPGVAITTAPRRDVPGADQALSMPWLSQFARHGVIAVTDAALLPPMAAEDMAELAACGVRALVVSAVMSAGVMFGSVAIARETPGAWPEHYIPDLSLLTAAMGSRSSAAHARESLAAAISRGDHARDSQLRFFSALGHELRTPIAAIVGSAEMLGSDARDHVENGAVVEETARFATNVALDADVILSAGEQLLAIVEDLLGTGKELGGGTESQWVDVADAVADVVHWLRVPALSAEVTVSADIAADTLVLTTPSGLRQILTNLIGNAVAYNAHGGKVEVTAFRAQNEFGDPRVRVSVTDTGPGLSAEQQRDVFLPFVRFAGPETKGTGLGLSLSRSLAERDGGMMGVESVQGEGSVFWVDLPAAAPGS